MNKQKQYANLTFVFSMLALSFLILSLPIKSRGQKESNETKEKHQVTAQVLNFVHSKAIKTADTVDLSMYTNIDVESARCDSAVYANRIQDIMKENGSFLSQAEKPILIGDVAPIGYKTETKVDLERMDQNLELKEAARGYHDAIVVLETNRRINQK